MKFKDADLIGLPIRLTIGERSLDQGGVEFKLRHAKDRQIIPMQDIVPYVQTSLASLKEELNQKVIDTTPMD